VPQAEAAVGKLKRYKFPNVDQIPAKLIQAGGETLHLEIHKLFKLVWNKEELLHQWKELIVVPLHKKGDKTYCSNYRGTSYADEIIVDQQHGFQRNRSTDQIFYIWQIL
jgi:hypothetical protein